MQLSLIVPFHRGLVVLERCLTALDSRPPSIELIVVADGAVDDCTALARRHGARVLQIEGPMGPAVARNRAAAVASGDVFVFVDSDVMVSSGSLDRLVRWLEDEPESSAVFGAYDETPGDPDFVSQYKNLAHSYIHQTSRGASSTFWAGFGAVRRAAYEAVGGFDERFTRPSIEDIDLGYRLNAAGYRVVLDPSLTACHLKRWTVGGMIASDVLDRGVPWTQLILRYGGLNGDLNVKTSYRACVAIAYLAVGAAAYAVRDARFLLAAAALLATLLFLGREYYAFFYRQRGLWFVLRVIPLHVLYHLYNGISFAAGTLLFLVNRSLGVQLPGALPVDPWSAAAADAGVPAKSPRALERSR